MKKLLMSIFACVAFIGPATASDGGVYIETSNVYSGTAQYTRAVNTTVAAPARATTRNVVVGHRPCGCGRATPAMNPVAVKTHTEVIDHYRVYQPVVEYIPVGTYTTRRVVSNIRPCDM